MRTTFILCSLLLSLSTYGQGKTNNTGNMKKSTNAKKDNAKNKAMACSFTTPELDARKATVLANLRTQVISRKELHNGFTYRFNGSDSTIDELISFIKTERHCCSFFDFSVKVSGDGSVTWLTITGPKGAKEFIKSELEL